MSSPMRVLQVAKHFAPDTGGIETVTLNISEALQHHDICADVLCTEVNGPYEELDSAYRVIRCKSDLAIGNKRLSWRYVEQARLLEQNYDCALVHLPNPLAVLGVLGWRKPIILLWHADIPQKPIRLAMAVLDGMLVRRAAAIISPTPIHVGASHHARAIAARGSVVIPYPFDQSLMPTATGKTPFAERLRLFRRGRALAISIGRLVPYKGFDVLIDAAREFGDQLCAIIVGTGPLAVDLTTRIAATGVGDRIMMVGGLTADELADALAQGKIGCMPSVTAAEMYGMAQVESMAAGLPVVSTAIPRSGVPYVNHHEKTGLVVPPGNADDLATALRRLVEDESLSLDRRETRCPSGGRTVRPINPRCCRPGRLGP
jgi:glycosyltransferase involved in cell wall biosynthesis